MWHFALLMLAQQVVTHTAVTNFYVNGVDQGDSICLRMNKNRLLWGWPITDLASIDMACGFNGTTGVNRVCSVQDGSTLTFEYRYSPETPGGKVLDDAHKGPCSVYMKKVESAIHDSAAGNGWFKIWDQGYDESTQQWCSTKLISNKGFLTVNIPKGLVEGYYLIRNEVMSLHQVPAANSPQYYVGCSQIFLQSDGNLAPAPASTVAIPGHVKLGDAGDGFNIYQNPLKLPYMPPGPPVAALKSVGRGAARSQMKQIEGLKPANCIWESGSNFCGVASPEYTNSTACWKSNQNCLDQVAICYNVVPPTGMSVCQALIDSCIKIQNQCQTGGSGPPAKGKALSIPKKTISIPPPLGPTIARSSSMPVASAST